MALLPDLVTAGGVALAVFLIGLGVLVVFVESLDRRKASVLILVPVVFAALLTVLGEFGIALIPLGLAAAVLANEVFEWLTTR